MIGVGVVVAILRKYRINYVYILEIDLKVIRHAWDPFLPTPSHPVSLTFYFLIICRVFGCTASCTLFVGW